VSLLSAWSRARPAADTAFVAAARGWMQGAESEMLDRVWKGYDALLAERPPFDGSDLERSVTEHLEIGIQGSMSGYEPFVVQHGPHERETKLPAPAQPPQYDIAFVFLADRRLMWPLEAKVLITPGALADYIADVNEQFLTCRYAPFSASGAMVGYLLTGEETTALTNIGARLGGPLAPSKTHTDRPTGVSAHTRTVPEGKPYPVQFECHHLILKFEGVSRV